MEVTTPVEKKLKQARLPFTVLGATTDSPQPTKKRKLETNTEEKCLLVNRTEVLGVKENLKLKSGFKRCREETIELVCIDDDDNSPKKLKEIALKIVDTSTKQCNENVKVPDDKKLKRASVRRKLLQFSKSTDEEVKSDKNISENTQKPETLLVNTGDCEDVDASHEEDDILSTTLESEDKEQTIDDIKTHNNAVGVKTKCLTPKQLQRQEETRQKNLEKLLAKNTKQTKLKEEREERRMKKLQMSEQKKRQKEEKVEERRKQKEDRERLRNKEKKAKEDERKKKEELRLEEKKKKDEEVQKKKEEEEMLKKKRAKVSAAFTSFFKKVENKTKDCCDVNNVSFMPFTIKPDMRVAPLTRITFDEKMKRNLDECVNEQAECETYLFELRSGARNINKCGNTWPLSEKYEVMNCDIIELCETSSAATSALVSNQVKLPRPKLLQFHENRRPPYWGTFRQKSKCVGARRPFGQHKTFDYDVDSDDEWEEEEPGESLHGSDDDKESEDDYEVDNDFFVPHGYLSDEENQGDEVMSPEAMKAKLKLLGEEFEAEMKTKTVKLIPVCIGCVWFTGDGPVSSKPVNSSVEKLLKSHQAVVLTNDPTPISTSLSADTDTGTTPSLTGSGGSSTSKTNSHVVRQLTVPESAMPDLIRLLHGNTNSKHIIKNEFCEYWLGRDPTVLSKSGIVKKIRDVSSWGECNEDGPMYGKYCWYVRPEVREKYQVCVQLPNDWCYVTSRKKTNKDDVAGSGGDVNVSLITKFTKVLTDNERRNSLLRNASVNNSSDTTEVVKKTDVRSTKLNKNVSQPQTRCVPVIDLTDSEDKSGHTPDPVPTTNSPKVNSQPLINSWLNRSGGCKKNNSETDGKLKKKKVALLVSVPRGQNIPPSDSVSKQQNNDSVAGNEEKSTVNNEKSTVNNEKSTVNHEKSTVNNEKSTVNDEKSTVNNEKSTVNLEKSTENNKKPTVNNEKPTVNNEKSTENKEKSTVNNQNTTVNHENVTENKEKSTENIRKSIAEKQAQDDEKMDIST